ncbi:MAG: PTS sugar transporter subunit IIA [Deltaproteobacteria bacterium]|nr:PTS sugar transporter subunit IIA [Deltaproteobacteria bacterium]
MIGLVIATHGRLGEELLRTAELIIGTVENCLTIPVELDLSPDELKTRMEAAIQSQDQGQGVLILTDMFGGTPSNISLSFLKEERVDILTGANLPMLLRACQQREKPDATLRSLALDSRDYARKGINMAGDMLGKRSRA